MFPFGMPVASATSTASTTWSPADKHSSIILSNNNRSAASSGAITYPTGRGTLARSIVAGGKYQFECTPSPAAGDSGVGIATSAASLSTYVGFEPSNGKCYYVGGSVYGGSAVVARSSYTTSDKIGIALDCINGAVTFYKNGVAQETLFGLSGAWFPACTIEGATGKFTLNCGQEPFSYPISGFVPWG